MVKENILDVYLDNKEKRKGMTDKEKLERIKSLADKMYNAAFNMTTDASLFRKAMDDYRQFIINEYHKEEPVSEELESEIDYLSKRYPEVSFAKLSRIAVRVAKWQKQQDAKLPKIWPRDTIDEYAYQCAYDLSNDWLKETPDWDDVQTACKLGANWQREQMMKDLPKWRYAPYYKGIGGFYDTTLEGNHIICHNGYIIEIKELEKLPKED